MTSRNRNPRISLEQRVYVERPSGRYHRILVDDEGNLWKQVACPQQGLLVDANDVTGSVPDALVCPVDFPRG